MVAQLYIICLVLGIVISIVVLLIGLSHRNNPARLFFVALMILITTWLIIQMVYMLVSDHQVKYFLNELKFIAIGFIPLFYWLAILRMFHIKRDSLGVQLIGLTQLLFLLLIATNPMHLLFRYNIRFIPFDQYDILVSDYNVGFWSFTLFTYFVMILAIVELLKVFINGTKNQRHQAMIFLGAAIFPTVLNLIFVFFLKNNFEDITPIGFSVTGALLLYGIFYHKLLDIVIRARSIIFEYIDDVIIICNLQGQILEMNPQAMVLLPDIKVNDNVELLIKKEFKTTHQNGIYTYVNQVTKDVEWYEIDQREIKRGRSSYGLIYYIRDVSQEIELKQALSVQKGLIEKDLADKGEYIRFLISHARDDVFRMDSLLLLGTIDSPETKRIADSALSLLKDQILNVESFMSFEKGEMFLKPEPCLVEAELGFFFEMISYEAQKKGLKFALDIENMPEKANLDMVKLKQILTNVLINAIKYTDEGIVKLYIHSNNREIVFSISDTGQGMTEEGLAQAMLPYTQADQQDVLSGGVGFGLTLVKELVTLMGGKLNIDSQLGQGTRVNFQVKYAPFEERIIKDELGLAIVSEVLKEIDIGILTDDSLFDAHVRYQLKTYPKSIVTLQEEKIRGTRVEFNLYIIDQNWLTKHETLFIERFEFRLIGRLPIILASQNMDDNSYKPSGNCHVIMKPFKAHDLYTLILKII